MSRKLNVDRMRRYRERTRVRYVWTEEEKRALLEHMKRRVSELQDEDRWERERAARRAERSGTIPGYWFDRDGMLRSLPMTLDGLDLLAPGVPYPVDPESFVPVHPSVRPRLHTIQREAGITVDGDLGPQTWVAACESARP